MAKLKFLLNLLILLLLFNFSLLYSKQIYIVVTDINSNNPYYQVVKELKEFRKVDKIIHFETNKLLSLEKQLCQIKPDYVVIVVEPKTINLNLVAKIFQISTKMDEDSQVDFAYGFITGAKPEYALILVRNTIHAENVYTSLSNKFSAVAEILKPAGIYSNCLYNQMIYYADCLNKNNWGTYVIKWNSKDDLIWRQEKTKFLNHVNNNKLIFFGGHGGPFGSIGIKTIDLNGINLFPAIVINGGCNTGVTYRYLYKSFNGSTSQKKIDVKESFALKLIQQGVIAHFTSVGEQCWVHCEQFINSICNKGESTGNALKDTFNYFIKDGEEVNVNLFKIDETYPNIEKWCKSQTRISTCLLYGDPAYKPFPDTAKNNYNLIQK